MKREHLTEVVVAFLVLTGIVAGWGGVWLTGDRSLERVREAGVIRAGYAVEPPYAFPTPDGGVSGEEAEVARWVAARLKIPRIEWKQVKFDRLIPELEHGDIDVIAAGMFITAERAKLVSFSDPVFHVRQGLLVRAGNPRGVHSYRQAAMMPNFKIAVLSSSVEEMLLRDVGASDAQLVAVPDAPTGSAAVESGLADGLALSSPTVNWLASRAWAGRVEAARPFVQSEQVANERTGYGAFAFRKQDRSLRKAWSYELEKFVGSREHLDLVAPFGFTEEEMPGAITTKEVLLK